MHRGHRHTADTYTEDTDTQLAQRTLGPWWTEWTVWTHTERHLESTDTQRPGSGWKTGVKKRHLDVDTVTHSFTWTMGTS